MCEHQETHRLVGDAADGGECFLGQRGGSASINDDDATFPYDEAGVGIAARDQRIHTLGQGFNLRRLWCGDRCIWIFQP